MTSRLREVDVVNREASFAIAAALESVQNAGGQRTASLSDMLLADASWRG